MSQATPNMREPYRGGAVMRLLSCFNALQTARSKIRLNDERRLR